MNGKTAGGSIREQTQVTLQNLAGCLERLGADASAVRGVSTEAMAGELDAGASAEEVAADFGLDLEAVRWAHSYELARHAAP